MLSDLQAHELHTKHSAEAMKAEKWQFEYKNLHDKYDALLKEKEVSWLGQEIKVQLWWGKNMLIPLSYCGVLSVSGICL